MENLISGKWTDWKSYWAASQDKWYWREDFQVTGRIYLRKEQACWRNRNSSRTFRKAQS